jgi:hypothetical protein
MSFTYLELRTDCPRCLQRVPINGIAQSLPCPRCQTPLQLAPEAVLSAVVTGREGQIGLFGTGGGVEGRFGPERAPRCGRCQGPLDVAHLADKGVASCVSCGAAASVRAVPEPWAHRVPEGVTHLVGEHFQAEAGESSDVPMVRRFYLWSDEDAERRIAKEKRRRARRVGAWLIGIGLPMCVAGVVLWWLRGAATWNTLGKEGFGMYVLLFAPLAAASVGAGLLSAGLRRFRAAFEVVLGLLGFALVTATSIYLYVKGFSAWPVAGLAVGSGWLWYVLRNVLPAV